MALLGIKVDVDGPMRAFKGLREEQLPFTIARALTMTAVNARDETRSLEKNVFTLRNDWTQQRTLTRAATKQSQVAEVYTDTENRTSGAPDYLPRQEDSGIKRPSGRVNVDGRSYIAVPTRYFRNKFGKIIPAELQARNLLGAVGGRFTAMRRTKGGGRQIALRGQKIVRGYVFFVQELKGGNLAIMGRNPDGRDPEPFYILITEAHIPAIFPAFEKVESVAQAVFSENFSKAAAETMANDLLRGSGISVKL